jgi:hypothetical protein
MALAGITGICAGRIYDLPEIEGLQAIIQEQKEALGKVTD